MAYDEQQVKHTSVVTETPTARRQVTQTQREYLPERTSPSPTTIAALVVLAVAIVGLLGLLFWNMKTNSDNANLAAQQPTPQPAVQQAAQPPIIVQQPVAGSQPPIIVQQPAAAPATGSNSGTVPDDSSIQMAIDQKLKNDGTLAALNITASVVNGKVLLVGTVKSDQLKNQVEKTVRQIKGVQAVDNQIAVTSS
jgi:flagellar basal body-associated protein FliL